MNQRVIAPEWGQRSRRGFSIIEVMISTLILMIILGGVLAVLRTGELIWSEDMGLVELQQKARRTMHGMEREIRQSQPTGLSVTGASDIRFSVIDEITDPDNPQTYYVRYYLDGNNQIIRENPASGTACSTSWSDSKCNILANDVNSLSFCCLGGASCSDCSSSAVHSVEIEFELDKSVRGKNLVLPFAGKVKLRNE